MTDMEKLVKLLDEFNRDLRPYAGETKYTIWDNHMDLAKYLTDNDVKQVGHGKWEYWAGGLPRCPICGYEYTDYVECKNYCGNCGTKLEDVE